MENSIMCHIEWRVHCHGDNCDKKVISIEWKGTSDFEKGERVCYPICKDFKDRAKEE